MPRLVENVLFQLKMRMKALIEITAAAMKKPGG
jgi:hypothetical protein